MRHRRGAAEQRTERRREEQSHRKRADKVAIRVIGMYFMNSPTMPGQNNSGEKAATRVAVAAITGPAMRVAAWA